MIVYAYTLHINCYIVQTLLNIAFGDFAPKPKPLPPHSPPLPYYWPIKGTNYP